MYSPSLKKENKDIIKYYNLSCCVQNIENEDVEKFKCEVNWTYVSYHRKLSEEFIREFQD